MGDKKDFEAIIIGGSYAGLSASMSLGRSLRQVLVIDSGKPCNRQTPHSHNFLTRDGETPKEISAKARAQVSKYDSVKFFEGTAISGVKTENGFEINTQSGDTFSAKKLVFASGLLDVMPEIKGYAECWGISILHCPYCHGYEVKNEKTGILANGDTAFELAKMISHWTRDLTIFTNGKSTLSTEQAQKIATHGIGFNEKEIDSLEHQNGYLQNIHFKDGSAASVKAVYSRPKFFQSSTIPAFLGCEISEEGLLVVDKFQRTNVPGTYACGDNSNFGRSVVLAVSSGSITGAFLNKALIDEAF